MSRSTRTLFATAFVAVAAVFLAACGSGGSSNPQDTLKKAFSTPIKSANVSLDLTLTLNGIKSLNGPIKLSLQGPFESGQGKTIPKVDWDIAASAGGQNFAAGFVSTGDDAFVDFQGQSYEIGKAAVAQINQQIQTATKNKNKTKSGLGQFGIHPSEWLTNAKSEGTAKIGSSDTDHVSAAFDIAKFLEDLNTLIQRTGTSGIPGASAAAQLTPQERAQIQKIVNNPRVDVYVGKSDHTLRRLSADVSFTIPQKDQAQLNGLTSGTLSFSIEFTNVGESQSITAPKSSKPISELTAKLGGLSSALGGSSSSSGGSSGGSTSQALQKYSECLAKANPSKPDELQKCAKLLK